MSADRDRAKAFNLKTSRFRRTPISGSRSGLPDKTRLEKDQASGQLHPPKKPLGGSIPSLGLKSPRVERSNARGFKIRDIPGHHRQAVRQRRGGDQSVPLRAWIWDMQLGATASNGGIDGENPPGERR